MTASIHALEDGSAIDVLVGEEPAVRLVPGGIELETINGQPYVPGGGGGGGAGASKAWVNFSAVGGVVEVLASFNVASVVRNGEGDFTINFETPMLDHKYAVEYTGIAGGGAAYSIAGAIGSPGVIHAQNYYRLQVGYVSSLMGAMTKADPFHASLVFYR